MTNSDSKTYSESGDDERHPVDLLSEEFAYRISKGESPEIEEYARKYPEHADLIRSVFPSIALVQRVSNRAEHAQHSGPTAGIAFGKQVVPESLGDFRLIREIGRGGMGVVYEAIQLSLKRHVALKVIGAIPSGSEKQQARFRREAEAAASLHHTHIVPVYGIGEDQGVQYYAMQLIDGVTLAEIVRFLQGDRPPRSRDVKQTSSQATFSIEDAVHLLLDSLKTPEHPVQDVSFDSAVKKKFLPLPATVAVPLAPNNSQTHSSQLAPQSSEVVSLSSPSHDWKARECEAPAELNAANRQRFQHGSAGASYSRWSWMHRCQTESETTSSGERGTEDHGANRVEALLPSPSISLPEENGEARANSNSKTSRLGQAYYRNVAEIVAKVANALQYAHHQGVLHRDIKPGNLLLDRDGMVWITDFGLARLSDCEGMTQTGEIVGTLRYMAPEQMRGQADHRTDIYSLGLTLFELLTLQPAIDQPQSRLYQKDSDESVAKLRSLNPDIPADLQTITQKACAAEPGHRYQAASALEEDLRRFLEDRPILARRTTRLERLYRWSRRNPTIAALSSATLLLLLMVAGMLAIFNQRKQMALNAISKQYNRAETNLQEKTIALAAVEKERARAELNLDIAIQAFDTVIANIASRGSVNSLLNDFSEDTEIIASPDATLSDADVVLLETLLGFFEKFAAENVKDLSRQTAEARRRVGDIQHQLGRLDDAEKSYRLALDAYQSKSAQDADDHSTVFNQAELLNDLFVIATKRGQMPKAIEYYEEARYLLEKQADIRNSKEGRFAIAKMHSSLASVGARFNREAMMRPRGLIGSRFAKPSNEPIPKPPRSPLKLEANANATALKLLEDLNADFPETIAYQLAYAQALRDEVRIARGMDDWQRASESIATAVAILEKLLADHPDSARSMKLTDELIDTYPNVVEYQSLRAQTLEIASMFQYSVGRKDRAEESLVQALEIHRQLADQHPDVLIYQVKFFQATLHLAELHTQLGRPDLAKQDYADALSRFENLREKNRFAGPLQPLMSRLRERQLANEPKPKE
jgi:serine/threonine protein kinase